MKEIIVRYLEDAATDSEKLELLHWLRRKENRKDFVFHRSVWERGLDANNFPAGGEETWNRIQSVMLEKSVQGWQKSRKIQQWMRYAAILFFVTTLGTLLLWYAGRPGAAGLRTTDIITDNGQISRVELPDGSKVWINSGSELSYNNQFGIQNRELFLKGEAYFDVSEMEGVPLVINCKELNIRVKGTKFNVNAYPEENNISVVLEEGSVELLRENNSSFLCPLKPGEMAIFDLIKKEMSVSTINTHRYTSWKEGIIHIYDQTLEEVAGRLTTRYNQEFNVSEEVKHYHTTFTIKNEPLSEIISLIEKITPVKAEQQGSVIFFRSARKVPGRTGK